MGQAVVAGNPWGGQVALELAVAEPDRIERRGLAAALAYPRHAGRVPIGFVVASVPVLTFLREADGSARGAGSGHQLQHQ